MDTSLYKELNSDPTQTIRNNVLSTLDFLNNTQRIDDVTSHPLTPPKPARSPLFHGLPKVHKPNISLQPIVSGFDSPTSQLSNYVTHFIQTLVETLPSYIRDSKHFLQLLESLSLLPENTILVTADVTSLYTNIPHEEGVKSVSHYMKLHAKTLFPGAQSHHRNGVLLETILKKSNPFSNLSAQPWEPRLPHQTPTSSWAVTKKPSGKPLSGQFLSGRSS